MAEKETGQERTEEATPKRQQDSREKGQIARSKELNTLLVMLVSGAGLMFLGQNLVEGLMQIMRDSLIMDRADIFDPNAMWVAFIKSLYSALDATLPLFLLLVMIAVIAPMALGGWSFTLKPLQPDITKLDPIKGMGKVFSAKGLMELAKALAKFLLVGSVGYILLMLKLPDFIALGSLDLSHGIALLGRDLIWAFILLSCALILVVLVDVPFQLWDHKRQQKMTLQEVKDEHKDTEGSPDVKRRIRQTQMEFATRRMMEEVPRADVVVTNPTHYAVALRYDQEKMGAPIVVALGVDEVAGHIRRIALAHDVPILSAPPLARALFFNTKLDVEIPSGLYLAVAQILAYVYQLRHYDTKGGIAPEFGGDVPIPDDLQHH